MISAPLDLTAKRFERILDTHPDLTFYGFGTSRSPSDTAEQRRRRFEADRTTLAGKHGEVAAIAAWLQAHIAPIKTPGGHAYSYALKHVAEDYFDGYVSNGELIAAALMAGYPMRRLDGPNAEFGMSKPDVDAVRRLAASVKAGRWSA